MASARRKFRARRVSGLFAARECLRRNSSWLARFEALEARQMMTVDLSLSGAQNLPAGLNVNASTDHASQQQNMAIDINPTSPLHVAGVSERNTPTIGNTLGLYRSADGGKTWATTTIDTGVDGKGAGATRFEPSIAYDSTGKLYVTYAVNDGAVTSLIVAESNDDGVTFAHVVTVDALANISGSLGGPSLGTGPDGLSHQAVYVAYDRVIAGTRQIVVSGSNDGGINYTLPLVISDVDHTFAFADPSVGPNGQLYVSWYDNTDHAVRIDRDLDGLFVGGNSFGADITVVSNATARPTLGGNFNLVLHQLVPASPNHGVSANPELDVDRSGKANNGNLYISFMDVFSGSDTDVYVARSTNNGTSWSFLPVTTPSSTDFMPYVDVDQASGSVNVLYYSTIGDTATGNDDVNIFVRTSLDGAQTFNAAQQITTATSRASVVAGGNDFLDYIGLAVHDATIQAMWSDNRGPSLETEAFTASASFDSLTAGNILTVTGDESGAANDAVIIRRAAANNAFVEVLLNGTVRYTGLIASLDKIVVNGLLGNDTLTVDNSNGVVNTEIDYDGGESLLDNDSLLITGNPGTAVARETFLAGAVKGNGTWVLDPNDSRGAGLVNPGDGDELTVVFTNLEPVDSDTPAVAFDAILTAGADNATVQNGGLLNTFDSLRVLDNGATFESFRFARKTNVRIMGQSGIDTLTANYTTKSTGLASLELDGNVATGILVPVDDNAADVLSVLSNAAGVAHTLAGQGGDDSFTVGNGDLSLILSPVAIVGGDGVDSLVVNDATRLLPVDYYVDPTTIAICTSPGPPPVHANMATFDTTLEKARLNGTQGVNRFDVTPSTTAEFTIDGNLPNTAPGDLLSIRFAGTTGAALTNVAGTGMWTFTNRMAVKFEDIERFTTLPIVAYSAEQATNGKPTVKVVDATTGAQILSFQAYESTYKSGVRVAVGDVTGDGIPEIITAPGRNRLSQVRVFDGATGTQLFAFQAYSNSYKGGVMVAVGDVNGDGFNDIVTAPSTGKVEIHTYLNQFATNPTQPFDNNVAHRNKFLAITKTFIGGATVAVGDVSGDAKAEIIVGSGAGIRDDVRIFDGLTNGSTTTTNAFLQRFQPFAPGHRGGVTVAVANIDADAKLELVVGASVGGQSQVATYDPASLLTPVQTFFAVYTGSGNNAPVRVAAVDADFNGVSDIYAAQGFDGVSQTLRRAAPGGNFVDFLMENDPEFKNGFFIGADINGIPPFLC